MNQATPPAQRRPASALVRLLPCLILLSRAWAAPWTLSGDTVAHDPTLAREDGTWWCFITGSGTPIKYSSDGRNWTQGGKLFDAERSWWRDYAPKMTKLDVWAPDLRKFGDRYWCYYSVSEFGFNNSAIGLLSCSSLAARDWRDEGFVIGSKSGRDGFNAIDPNLAVDAEGAPWLVFGSWFSGIQLVKLDPTTMKPAGEPRTIAKKDNGIEGPALVRANGFYYLFVSVDLCCKGVDSTYKIAVGRSKQIEGPYRDKEGREMLKGGYTVLDVGDERWKGPGGQSVYETGDGWLLVYHSYDADNRGKPRLMLRDLYWDAEDWPSYGPRPSSHATPPAGTKN